MKRLWTIVILLLLVFGLAAGSTLLKQKTGFDLRKKADAVVGSQLLLKGPTEVKPGETFEVQVLIDTMPDNQYSISGADAVVSFDNSNVVIDYPAPPAGCRYVDVQCFKAPCNKQLVCETPVGNTQVWGDSKEEMQGGGSGSGSPVQIQVKPTEQVVVDMTDKEVLDGTKLGVYTPTKRSDALQLISVVPGTLFDSYPTLQPKPILNMTCGGIAGKKCPEGYYCNVVQMGLPQREGEAYPDVQGTCMLEGPKQGASLTNPVTISGIKNYSVDENGVFQGLRGGGVFATLTFVAPQSGDINIRLNYNGPEATNDSNINGFSVAGPVSIQKPVERLLTQPNSLSIKVASVQAECRKMGCSGTICSDSKEEWYDACQWTESYSCYQNAKCERQANGLCGFSPTEEFNSCLAKYNFPSPTPVPSLPKWCDQDSDCRLVNQNSVNSCCGYNRSSCGGDYSNPDFVAVNSLATGKLNTTYIQTKCQNVDCGPEPMCPNINPEMVNFKAVCSNNSCQKVPNTPTKYGTIKASMIFEGMQNRPLEIKLYGDEFWYDKMLRPSRPPYFLGSAKSQPDGSATFQVPAEYLNRMFTLYIETPSHLRQYQANRYPVKMRVDEPMYKTLEVDFGVLIPGDIYADSLGQKDQTINTFDVSTSYSQWSVGAYMTLDGRIASDLNGDGAVNNRDLAILLSNFGKSSRGYSRQTVVPLKKLVPVELPR